MSSSSGTHRRQTGVIKLPPLERTSSPGRQMLIVTSKSISCVWPPYHKISLSKPMSSNCRLLQVCARSLQNDSCEIVDKPVSLSYRHWKELPAQAVKCLSLLQKVFHAYDLFIIKNFLNKPMSSNCRLLQVCARSLQKDSCEIIVDTSHLKSLAVLLYKSKSKLYDLH